MRHGRPSVLLLLAANLAGGRALVGQELPVGIIDFYGLKRVPAAQVRQVLSFKEGDTVSLGEGRRPPFLAESEERLSRQPGVRRAHVEIVCCDEGRALVFVGIEEDGAPVLRFRRAPRGTVRLGADLVQAGNEFSKALLGAVTRGDAAEDDSLGHALAHDPAMRAIQERFVGYADRDLPALRRVLRDSSDAGHRALAAQVLGYVADKQAAVDDLVYAMSDPCHEVRNNAMRALLVFAAAAPPARPVSEIPLEPFVALLASPAWSDRNKASAALMALSKSRDRQLLARLRTGAMTPLVEMARWKSEPHALPAFVILGRIAEYSDEAAQSAWDRGERDGVINAALRRH